MKSIPTTYSGTRFRSRLEARYAAFFDRVHVSWVYEVDGVEFDGTCYLPDFWLPECRIFFEVKGPLRDRAELVDLAQSHIDKESGDMCHPDYPLFMIGDECGVLKIGNHSAIDVWFVKCRKCSTVSPRFDYSGYTCRACGFSSDQVSEEVIFSKVIFPQMQWERAA